MRVLRSRHNSGGVSLLITILILTALAIPSSTRADSCTPSFPYDRGWLGADGAYSIPLDNDRTLWLFGDTFVSTHRTQTRTRAGSRMIANSIAISSCDAAKWTIDYHWNTFAHRHRPRPFFDSRTGSFRYWPLDGFLYNKTLYVALLRVRSTHARGPFAFKLLGVDLATITNPDADPRNWSITYRALSRSRTSFPGGSIVVRAPYVYLLGVIDHARHSRHSLILTRIYLDHLDHPANSLEYLDARHQWHPAPIRADADQLTPDGQVEFSVRYHPEISRWVLLQQQPGFLTDQIVMSTAPHLDGPWSNYRSLTTEPEMHRHTRRKHIFCYAAKEHPEFESSPAALLATYACNSLHLRNLIRDMSIYRPVVIQLPML